MAQPELERRLRALRGREAGAHVAPRGDVRDHALGRPRGDHAGDAGRGGHAGRGDLALDPAAARPAGALFRHDGALIRPAQDCRDGYGAGLAFARVDRLDETGFAQTIIARSAPRTPSLKGLHTYNRAGDVEVIDLFGRF